MAMFLFRIEMMSSRSRFFLLRLTKFAFNLDCSFSKSSSFLLNRRSYSFIDCPKYLDKKQDDLSINPYTRYVFRISKFVILPFFRIQLISIGLCYFSQRLKYLQTLDIICVIFLKCEKIQFEWLISLLYRNYKDEYSYRGIYSSIKI